MLVWTVHTLVSSLDLVLVREAMKPCENFSGSHAMSLSATATSNYLLQGSYGHWWRRNWSSGHRSIKSTTKKVRYDMVAFAYILAIIAASLRKLQVLFRICTTSSVLKSMVWLYCMRGLNLDPWRQHLLIVTSDDNRPNIATFYFVFQ